MSGAGAFAALSGLADSLDRRAKDHEADAGRSLGSGSDKRESRVVSRALASECRALAVAVRSGINVTEVLR